MTVYDHITNNNPNAAAAICNKWGYPVSSIDEIPETLYQIAQRFQADGLKDIFEIHPEKDVIIELYAQPVPNCGKCAQLNQGFVRTNQADGGTSTMQAPTHLPSNYNISSVLETNKLLVIAIVTIAGIFLLKKA